MTRENFTEGQEILFTDLNNIAVCADKTILDELMPALLDTPRGLRGKNAMKVYRVTATSIGVGTGAGFGLQPDAFKSNHLEPYRTLMNHVDHGDSYVISPAHATLDRYDRVEVRCYIDGYNTDQRNIKSTLGDISEQSCVVQAAWETEIRIVTGTPGSLTAPAATDGWEGLAILHVMAVTGIPVAEGIQDIRMILKPENQTIDDQSEFLWNWTTMADTFFSVAYDGTVPGLVISTSINSAGATYQLRAFEGLFAGLYAEFIHALSQGLSLKIRDANDVIWTLSSRIVTSDSYEDTSYSQIMASLGSIITMAGGGTGSPQCKFIIKDSGQNFIFGLTTSSGTPVEKSMTSFATFATIANVQRADNPYRLKFYRQGPERTARSINGSLRNQLARRYWKRGLRWGNSPAVPGDITFQIDMVAGRRYRCNFMCSFKFPTIGTAGTFLIYQQNLGSPIPSASYETIFSEGFAPTTVANQFVHLNRSFEFTAKGTASDATFQHIGINFDSAVTALGGGVDWSSFFGSLVDYQLAGYPFIEIVEI